MSSKQELLDKTKITLDDAIYVILAIFIFFHVLNSMSLLTYKYDFKFNYLCIRLCRAILFLYCIYSNRIMGSRRFVEFVIFLLISFITLWRVNSVFLDIFMLAFTARRDFQKTINTFFYSLLLATVTIVCLDAIGIMPKYITYRSDGVRRYTLGFTHANYLAFMIVLLIIILLIKDNEEHFMRDAFFVFLSTIFCYYVPNSITSTIILLIIGVIILTEHAYRFIFKKNIIQNKLIQKGLIIALPCTAIIVYYLIFNLDGTFAFDINYTLLSRINQSRIAIEQYGFSFWGQKVDLVSSMAIYFGSASQRTFFALDSLFIYLPIRYGIVPSIYFAYQYTKSIRLYIKKKNSVAIMICLILILYSIIETVFLNLVVSFIFICAYADDYKQQELLEHRMVVLAEDV